MTFFFRAYADTLWFLISWFMTNYWKKRPKLFLILIDKKTVGFTQSPFFQRPATIWRIFSPYLIWLLFFGNFLQFLASFFAGSIPWFHYLLRRYLYLPWHVFRSLRFLEANSFGSRCIIDVVILVGMGCYHLFRYVFPSIHLNKCQNKALFDRSLATFNQSLDCEQSSLQRCAVNCDWLKDEK